MTVYFNPIEMAREITRIILEAGEPMSRSEIMEALHVWARERKREFTATENTVYRWLDRAIQHGFIERSGNTSAASYTPTAESRITWVSEQLQKPVIKRPKVGYREEFLRNYIPNKTFYLSEAQRDRLAKKCPPGSAYIEKISQRDVALFLNDLTYWSSRLEGMAQDYAATVEIINALKERRLKEVSERGIQGTLDDKIIHNHVQTVEHIINSVPSSPAEAERFGNRPVISRSALLGLHSIISYDLFRDPAMSGRVRQEELTIGYSQYVPLRNPQRVAEMFELLVEKAQQIKDPWELSMFMNVHIPYLQPFADCNKRTARVGCNLALLSAGVLPMSWVNVDERHYKDSVLAIYEFQCTEILADIFTDSYIRSTEQFEMMQRNAEPNRFGIDYRNEIRTALRSRIMYDQEVTPTTIPAEHLATFQNYVDRFIKGMWQNPHSVLGLGISEADVLEYMRRNPQRDQPAAGDPVPTPGTPLARPAAVATRQAPESKRRAAAESAPAPDALAVGQDDDDDEGSSSTRYERQRG